VIVFVRIDHHNHNWMWEE